MRPTTTEMGSWGRATSLVVRTILSAVALLLPSVDTSFAAPMKKEIRDRFEYKPVNRDIWGYVDRLIKAGKAPAVFSLAPPQGDSTALQDEWKLELTKALIATGQTIHAQYLLSMMATKSVGTRQGFEALRMIHEIAKAGPVDEVLLEDLAFELDTKIDEPESRSMIGYFRARALLRKGYAEWAAQALAEVMPNSTWNDELSYDRAMQTLGGGDSATAYTDFEALTKSPAARRPTAQMAKLALARLVFERRDYRASISTYTTIELPTRERARSFNELAWSYYYDRAYGKALGAIRALKSPYYFVLVSPETFLLEMLIYRELCHYRKVKAISAEFQNVYRLIYTNIEERRPLEKIPQLVQMSLQEGVMQKRAIAIQQVRSERKAIQKQKWSDRELKKLLLRFAEKRENIADAEITRMLRLRVDSLANWFIDLREQVWFLDYEASMRMIQLNDDLAEQYEPPAVNKVKPDILFWPLNDEAWRDELLDYEVLVHDSCKASPLIRPSQPAPGRSKGGGR